MNQIDSELKNAWIRQIREDWRSANYLYFGKAMEMPDISLFNSHHILGKWEGGMRRRLSLSEVLIKNHPWLYVNEVLHHEMAHQYVEEILGITQDLPHGEAFRRVCAQHAFDHRASGDISEWIEKKNALTDPTDSHRMLNKIQKLLSLAQSNNIHEAELAMAKAQELLLKHNLSLLELNVPREYIYKQIGEVGRKNPIKSMLAFIIKRFFFIEALWVHGYNQNIDKAGKILEIYGTRENVDLAEYVYHYLLNTAEDLWQGYKRLQHITGNKKRQTFIIGLLHGFREKLETSTKAHQAENLVWRGDSSLKEYFSKKNPKIQSSSSRYSRLCQTTYQAGKAQGKSLVIHKGINSKGQRKVHLLTDPSCSS